MEAVSTASGLCGALVILKTETQILCSYTRLMGYGGMMAMKVSVISVSKACSKNIKLIGHHLQCPTCTLSQSCTREI